MVEILCLVWHKVRNVRLVTYVHIYQKGLSSI